jgi:hypothetical protein
MVQSPASGLSAAASGVAWAVDFCFVDFEPPHRAKNDPGPETCVLPTALSFWTLLLIEAARAAVVIVSSVSRSKGIAYQTSPTAAQYTEKG